MKRNLLIVPLLTLALGACGQGGTSGGGQVDSKIKEGKELASKGGVTIHEGYVELIKRVNPSIQGQIGTPAGKKRLVDSLLEQELLYKVATDKGVDKLPQFQEKLALYQRAILGQSLLEEEINRKSKEYYEANKDKEFTRAKVSQILVKIKNPEDKPKTPPPVNPKDPKAKPPVPENTGYSETEALKVAQDVKAKLAGGLSWDDAVNQFSMDNLSKSRKGDLGYLSQGDRRVARMGWEELVTKAFSLKPGEISDPIKSKSGYHIIRVEEAPAPLPFEEAQNSIKFKMRTEIRKEILDGVAKGETEYKDPELKAIPEPGMALPGQPAPGAPTPGGAAPSLQVTPKKPEAPAAPKPDAKGSTTAATKPTSGQ
jgi:parvulin-like peptidyl-prolyl isomerase